MIKIIAAGSCLPEQTLSNLDLEKIVDTTDTWIKSRTGICSRHIVSDGQTTTFLAVQAAKKALQRSGLEGTDIDIIIVATTTPHTLCPTTACQVQEAIGALCASCWDINAGCSGFLFALSTAYAYLKSGLHKTALIIGAETLSTIVDWTDRSSCILFGDGAGAVILSKTEEGQAGIIDIVTGSDGGRGEVLSCKKDGKLHMNGQEVFKFALTQVPKTIQNLLERNHLQPLDIDWYLLHQANERIIHSIARRLKVPKERFPMNLSYCGNTSAASIPILLDECIEKGLFQSGQRIILAGFGAGLTWGSVLLNW